MMLNRFSGSTRCMRSRGGGRCHWRPLMTTVVGECISSYVYGGHRLLQWRRPLVTSPIVQGHYFDDGLYMAPPGEYDC